MSLHTPSHQINGTVDTILQRIPEPLIHLIRNNLAHTPVTTIRYESAMGIDTINRVHPYHLSSPVAVGVDDWNRNFVCFKISWRDTLHNKTDTTVFTFFQTHREYPSWSMATSGPDILNAGDNPLPHNITDSTTIYRMKPHLYEILSNLLSIGSYRYHNILLSLTPFK